MKTPSSMSTIQLKMFSGIIIQSVDLAKWMKFRQHEFKRYEWVM